jgi:hypothetical protein
MPLTHHDGVSGQVPEPHADIGDWWTLYDYGLDTVKTWAKGRVLLG